MEYIFYGGLIFLAIIGISDLICYLGEKFYPTQNKIRVILLPLKGEVKNIEYTIKSIIAKEKNSPKMQIQIYIIDLGINYETLEIINIIKKKYSSIYICNIDNVESEIRKNL